MRLLVYTWTQVFLLGLGGIVGALLFHSFEPRDESLKWIGGFIGGICGIVLARIMLSYGDTKPAVIPTPPQVTPPPVTNVQPNLIACSDCGRMISRRAVSCPQCGCPNTAE